MVELLAPAGSYDSFLGALNAGADAIYLGGEKYSARAYADNFTTEQILKAIGVAHIHNCKVYLTLNTLLKESEIEDVVDYVKPFYLAGLDGVIVQDLGVVHILHTVFSDMEIHASTQMTITGVDGALFAHNYGFSRVVPARELSLLEIRTIKEQVPVEIECFIHGAMCYGYSGQCLFSSILGGRSGNRGRCAGPCRLPYRVQGPDIENNAQEAYPISMKDMCVLYKLPELIETGIDSFKIEGRMKSPAYAAGVTALYRKYIDLYMREGKTGYRVEQKDIDTLMHLYIRSEISDGYYDRHNSEKMITLEKPSYLGTDDRLAERLIAGYVKEPEKIPVKMSAFLQINKPMRLTIEDLSGAIQIAREGPLVQEAKQRPVARDQVIAVFGQLGNTELHCAKISASVEEGCFAPVGQLKELRRLCVQEFEKAWCVRNGFQERNLFTEGRLIYDHTKKEKTDQKKNSFDKKLHVSCKTMEQLEVLLHQSPARVYIDSDLWMHHSDRIDALLSKETALQDTQIMLMLPYVKRLRDDSYFGKLAKKLREKQYVHGMLVRTIDELQFAWELKKQMKQPFSIVGDSSLYVMNPYSALLLREYVEEYTLPLELNYQELRSLSDTLTKYDRPQSIVVYGWIPMLISANCIRKTSGHCDHKEYLSKAQALEDRYQKKFPVYNNCEHCYNVIYNSVPLSLHTKWKQLKKMNAAFLRLDFVYESGKECERIYQYYLAKRLGMEPEQCPVAEEYTTGHFTRGIL